MKRGCAVIARMSALGKAGNSYGAILSAAPFMAVKGMCYISTFLQAEWSGCSDPVLDRTPGVDTNGRTNCSATRAGNQFESKLAHV